MDLQPGGQRFQLCRRLFRRHALTQTSEQIEFLPHRLPERGIRRLHRRNGHPRLDLPRVVDVRRYDPYDGEGLGVDQHASSEHLPGSAVAPLPEFVGDDEHVLGPGAVVFGRERATDDRLDAESFEELARDPGAQYECRCVAVHEDDGTGFVVANPGDALELSTLAPNEVQFGGSKRPVSGSGFGQRPPPDEESRFVWNRQRAQQDASDQGKDHNRAGQPNGQRQHRGNGETWRASETPSREPQIVPPDLPAQGLRGLLNPKHDLTRANPDRPAKELIWLISSTHAAYWPCVISRCLPITTRTSWASAKTRSTPRGGPFSREIPSGSCLASARTSGLQVSSGITRTSRIGTSTMWTGSIGTSSPEGRW